MELQEQEALISALGVARWYDGDMDPIEVIELCVQGARHGAPKDLVVPVFFSHGDYDLMWKDESKRVRRMLDEIMCAQHPQDGLELLMKAGVFRSLFPELCGIKNLGDMDGLHKDVWEHTLNVVANVAPELDLRWAALLHDIGKAATRRVQKGGRVTFHNHDIVGARMVDAMQLRTKLFQDDVALLRTVRYLVLEHLRPHGYNSSWTDSAVRRLVTECGDSRFFEKLMKLARADLTTKNQKKRMSAGKRSDELEKRVADVIAQDSALKLPKNVMGEILKASSVRPGAWCGELRDRLESLMNAGVLLPNEEVSYYVKAGLDILEYLPKEEMPLT